MGEQDSDQLFSYSQAYLSWDLKLKGEWLVKLSWPNLIFLMNSFQKAVFRAFLALEPDL